MGAGTTHRSKTKAKGRGLETMMAILLCLLCIPILTFTLWGSIIYHWLKDQKKYENALCIVLLLGIIVIILFVLSLVLLRLFGGF